MDTEQPIHFVCCTSQTSFTVNNVEMHFNEPSCARAMLPIQFSVWRQVHRGAQNGGDQGDAEPDVASVHRAGTRAV